MSVTVYSKPGCTACTATVSALDKQGIAYEVVDMSQDAAAMAHARALGFMQAPVVIPECGEPWSGFRPDKILALSERP